MAQPSPTPVADLVLPDGPVADWPAKTMVVLDERVVLMADPASDGTKPWAAMDDAVLSHTRFSHADVTGLIKEGAVVFVHDGGPVTDALAPPADGWVDGDWVVIANGLIAHRDGGEGHRVPWVLECTPQPRYVDDEISHLVLAGRAVYIHAPRDPQPLPTDPGSAISATVQTEHGRASAVLVLTTRGVWRAAEPVLGKSGFGADRIVDFEPLLTHTQWARRTLTD